MMDYDIRNGRTYMYYKDDVLYPFGYGLSYTTFDYQQIKSVKQDKDKVTVTVLVKNSGSRDGEEVVLDIPKEDFAYWDEIQDKFVVEPGKVKLLIGASSADIRLEGEVTL